MLARDQPVFVFGMHGHAARARAFSAARMSSSRLSSSVPVDEPRNAFTPAYAGHAFELGQRADIGGRRADIERIVAMHAAFGAGELVFDGGARGGRRGGVGHFEHGGHAAQHGGAAAAFQVFLVLVAGFAEMDLAVDHAGQDMQPLGLEGLCRLGGAERANGGDFARL